MSDFARCLLRNFIIGLAAGCICYAYCHPWLMEDGSTQALTLLGTSCAVSFSFGAILWSNNNDSALFRYILLGMRSCVFITGPLTFLGAFIFPVWGIGIGVVSGLWLSTIKLKYWPHEYPYGDKSCATADDAARVLQYPVTIIPCLALGCAFLFDQCLGLDGWWGMGAGIIGGSLLSFGALALAFWGGRKTH